MQTKRERTTTSILSPLVSPSFLPTCYPLFSTSPFLPLPPLSPHGPVVMEKAIKKFEGGKKMCIFSLGHFSVCACSSGRLVAGSRKRKPPRVMVAAWIIFFRVRRTPARRRRLLPPSIGERRWRRHHHRSHGHGLCHKETRRYCKSSLRLGLLLYHTRLGHFGIVAPSVGDRLGRATPGGNVPRLLPRRRRGTQESLLLLLLPLLLLLLLLNLCLRKVG